MNWVLTGVLIATAMLYSRSILLLSMTRAFLRAIVESFLTALRDAGYTLRTHIVLELSPTMATAQVNCAASQIGATMVGAPRAPPLLRREGIAFPSKDPALKINPLCVRKAQAFHREAQAFQRSDLSWLFIS
jgi:hypothetical protein